MQSQVTGLREHASELRTQSDEALASAIAQVEVLTNTVSEQQGRLEEAIRSNQDQFSAAQERRVEQFGEQASEFEGRIAKAESEAKEKLDATETRLVEDSRTVMSEVQEQLAEAQRIVGAIATTGTVGGFQIEASSQRRTANLLRVAALTTGLGAAILAIWGVIHAQQSSSDTVDVLAKGLASFIFFGIAGYLATQSGGHRDREERARRRELELAAFGPFIGDLSEERQEALVEKLADRIFGHELPATNGDDGLTKENVSLVGQIATIIRGTSEPLASPISALALIHRFHLRGCSSPA